MLSATAGLARIVVSTRPYGDSTSRQRMMMQMMATGMLNSMNFSAVSNE